MKLSKIEITNFRCFESLSIPLQPDVNVFVGVNGAGKTAILDAIAIALYDIVAANGGGGKRQQRWQKVELRPSDIYITPGSKSAIEGRKDFVQFRAEAIDFYEVPGFSQRTPLDKPNAIEWMDDIRFQPPNGFIYETSRNSSIRDYYAALWQEIRRSETTALIPLPVVAYYRADRRLTTMPNLGNVFELELARQTAFENALDAGSHHKAMCQWFYARENTELREKFQLRQDPNFELPDLKAVRSALFQMLEGVKRVFFDETSLKVSLERHGMPASIMELEQLSGGYRVLLAVVLDFARRLALAHPNWPNPLMAPGILLIDEVELHLHPKWQQRIIPQLQETFPKTQLIIATHSPQVLTTVHRKNIAIIKDQNLYSPSVNTYGAESKRAMEMTMETDSRPPDNSNADQIRQLFALINAGNFDGALTLCNHLMQNMGADEPALVEAQAIIGNRKWEKELGL